MAVNPDIFCLWDLSLRSIAQLIGFSTTVHDRYQGRLQEFGFLNG